MYSDRKNIIGKAFEEYSTYIFTYAVKLTANINAAEDLTQDTFLTAVEKYHQLNDINLIKYWLRKICLNKYLEKLRRSRYNEIFIDTSDCNYYENISSLIKATDNPSVEDEIVMEESLREIKTVCFLTVVHRMKLTQRMVFIMVEMFGLDTKDVSDIFGLTIPAVKSHLNRSRVKIDEELIGKCGLISVDNPCRCKAWEKFVNQRELRKANIRFITKDKERLCIENNDEAISKLKSLFENMSDFVPSAEWFEKVSRELEILFSQTES